MRSRRRAAAIAVWACGSIALGAGSAVAAQGPTDEFSSQTLRDFTLRNETGRTIVEAHAYTTTGKDIEITKSSQIRSRMAQNFAIQHAECVDRIQVRFAEGGTLTADKLNDCNNPRFVARDDGITVETGAGGPLHPSAASRANQGAKTP